MYEQTIDRFAGELVNKIDAQANQQIRSTHYENAIDVVEKLSAAPGKYCGGYLHPQFFKFCQRKTPV